MTIYAISDIHGQIGMLEGALEKIAADGGDDRKGGPDEVIFLGDLVDRGPYAREVNERVLQGIATGRRWTALRGNHDRMFMRFLKSGIIHDTAIKSGMSWLTPPLGGCETLRSYGVDAREDRPVSEIWKDTCEAVPDTHRAFLHDRPVWVEREGLLFVHAGIRPGIPLAEQAEDDLLWIRQDFYAQTTPFPWLIVHGHTILEEPTHFGNRIDLDTGAGARPEPRQLTVAAFEGTDCFILEEGGVRRPLLPEGE